MTATIKSILGALAGGLVFGALTLSAGAALAGGAGGCGCSPPPPCCAPPTPPAPPSPPPTPCCAPPTPPHGYPINLPGVNVNINIAASLTVNTTATAAAQSSASAGALGFGAANSMVLFNGGGGGGGGVVPGATSYVQSLNVLGGEAQRTAFESTRTRMRKVIIEASCIDDKDVPHPASQVTPDRDIEDSYDGEIYRCIAGTHMQYVLADYAGQANFEHGETVICGKAEALYHAPGGNVACRAQRPARDCNERSLLRRFGAGVKILTMISVERFTDYRESSVQTQSASSISLDGGVGGMVY